MEAEVPKILRNTEADNSITINFTHKGFEMKDTLAIMKSSTRAIITQKINLTMGMKIFRCPHRPGQERRLFTLAYLREDCFLKILVHIKDMEPNRLTFMEGKNEEVHLDNMD